MDKINNIFHQTDNIKYIENTYGKEIWEHVKCFLYKYSDWDRYKNKFSYYLVSMFFSRPNYSSNKHRK